MTATPNHALQRTRAAVTPAASGLRLAPAAQRSRQPRGSLSLGSLGHMSTRILFLAVLVSLMAGCVCDFEGVETQRVAVRDVSDRALAAFVRTYPGEAVEQVETHTFKRKIVSYTVTFRRADSSSHRVEFTRDGVVIPPRVDAPVSRQNC